MKNTAHTKEKVTVRAIEEGTVIDHIPSDMTFKVAEILELKKLNNRIIVATNLSSKTKEKKGIIKVSKKNLTKEEANKISLIAPTATLNIIKDYKVQEKSKLELPAEIKNIAKCSNPACITNNEKVNTKFYVLDKEILKLRCYHCERHLAREDIKLA